jgi:chromosome segregation ATPase
MAEDKYVLRHEWENSRGKIHQRINDVDSKHTDLHNQLLSKVDRQTLLQEKSFESQERSEKHLEKMSESLSTVGTRVTDLEYESKANKKDIESLQGTLREKTKGNTQVIVAWIGVAGVVLPAVITVVAQFFR